jgi:hypothetical protein
MPKRGAVLMGALVAALMGGWVLPAVAQPARVEQTGQTTSYAAGDDGAIQAGVPFPSPRFTDRKNGTVRDNLTGLIWLKNAVCNWGAGGPLIFDWLTALSLANNLRNGKCGLTDGSVAGDWRLPNIKELASLIDYGFYGPAISNAAGTGPCTPSDCAFINLQPDDVYWSSTTEVFSSIGSAYTMYMEQGVIDYDDKTHNYNVWPVRGGK